MRKTVAGMPGRMAPTTASPTETTPRVASSQRRDRLKTPELALASRVASVHTIGC